MSKRRWKANDSCCRSSCLYPVILYVPVPNEMTWPYTTYCTVWAENDKHVRHGRFRFLLSFCTKYQYVVVKLSYLLLVSFPQTASQEARRGWGVVCSTKDTCVDSRWRGGAVLESSHARWGEGNSIIIQYSSLMHLPMTKRKEKRNERSEVREKKKKEKRRSGFCEGIFGLRTECRELIDRKGRLKIDTRNVCT